MDQDIGAKLLRNLLLAIIGVAIGLVGTFFGGVALLFIYFSDLGNANEHVTFRIEYNGIAFDRNDDVRLNYFTLWFKYEEETFKTDLVHLYTIYLTNNDTVYRRLYSDGRVVMTVTYPKNVTVYHVAEIDRVNFISGGGRTTTSFDREDIVGNQITLPNIVIYPNNELIVRIASSSKIERVDFDRGIDGDDIHEHETLRWTEARDYPLRTAFLIVGALTVVPAVAVIVICLIPWIKKKRAGHIDSTLDSTGKKENAQERADDNGA